MKRILVISLSMMLIFIFQSASFSQRPPEAFFEGLNNYTSNPALAKTQFEKAINDDSTFFGSYNFLGTILDQEKNYDAAIKNLLTAVRLNANNVSHTREMTLEHLCRVYLHMGNFELAYHTALKSINEFPENKSLVYQLREVCLWAYNTQYAGLSKEYLHPVIKPDYLVNGVSQEYLIMRNITVNNQSLHFMSQYYNGKKNIDVLKCSFNDSKDSVNLVFKLGWEVLKTFGDNMPDYKVVYTDKAAKIWFRLGAILSSEKDIDILKEIGKIEK